MFQKSLETSSPSTAAFTATNRTFDRANQKGLSSRNNRRAHWQYWLFQSWPWTQLFWSRTSPSAMSDLSDQGHYADRCNQRYTRLANSAHLAESFNASCSMSENEATNWYLDTGASAHMTTSPSTLDHSNNYTGKDFVIVGNGASLPITHTGTISPNPNLHLLDVLNHQTGRVVATGKRDGGLYVLERGHPTFLSVLKNKSLHASYDLMALLVWDM
ncbi:hypothetical protein Patl1_37129 [Pistacia atlantica]|nr:hypothetical protein Patl1_37129 [Pistacia atlantica]